MPKANSKPIITTPCQLKDVVCPLLNKPLKKKPFCSLGFRVEVSETVVESWVIHSQECELVTLKTKKAIFKPLQKRTFALKEDKR